MSVRAQNSSNVLLSEFCKRARHNACDSFMEMPVQEPQLPGLDFLPPPVMIAGIVKENGISRLSVSERKKFLEENKHLALLTPVLNPAHGSSCCQMFPDGNDRSTFTCAELNLLQPTYWACSSGIRHDNDFTRLTPVATSTIDASANANAGLCFFVEDGSFNLQFCQHQLDIDHIIANHNELLKQNLEDKRRQHTRMLLDLIERGMLCSLRERTVEIEKLRCRNTELEEVVKKLSLESQVWMNIAQSQETLVTSLRSSLENVVAQRNEKAGSGDSCAEDAESCVFGEPLAAIDVNMRTQAISESREQRICCHCWKNGISVLVVPCRHLCLCTDCDPIVTRCPVCGISKDASLQVYMD